MKNKESNVVRFAREELAIIKKNGRDPVIDALSPEIMDVIKYYDAEDDEEGTSGTVVQIYAGHLANTIHKLCLKKDLKEEGIEWEVEIPKEVLFIADRFRLLTDDNIEAPSIAHDLADKINSLCLMIPISPLTGEESEWFEYHKDEKTGKSLYQSKRCPTLFKDGEDEPYYLDAIAFKNENDTKHTGYAVLPDEEKVYSRQQVKQFPFTPKTFIVDVVSKEISKDDWESYVIDVKQVDAAFETHYTRK